MTSTHAQIVDCSGKTRIPGRGIVFVNRFKVYIGTAADVARHTLESCGRTFSTREAAEHWVNGRGLTLV